MSNVNIPELTTPSITRLKQASDSLANRLRVALPGIVKSFDATKQTVSVQPSLRELVNYIKVSGRSWQTTYEQIDLPVIPDVPIQLPRCGGFVLAMPVKEGDECIIVFADMCIDAWFQSGGVQNQVELRRHDLSDAFAILGTWSQPRKLADYPTDAAELRTDDGSVRIRLTGDTVEVIAQTVTVQASGTATVQGDQVNVTGSTSVHISGNGQTTIEGKDWLTHKHSGVQGGGAVSGPVV